MTTIQAAREDFTISVSIYMACKALISKIVGSAEILSETQLKLERQKFENALKDLNRTHTIWRCRCDEIDHRDFAESQYSEAWLENKWYEHDTLDDEIEEMIYSYSLRQYSRYDRGFCFTNLNFWGF